MSTTGAGEREEPALLRWMGGSATLQPGVSRRRAATSQANAVPVADMGRRAGEGGSNWFEKFQFAASLTLCLCLYMACHAGKKCLAEVGSTNLC